MKLNLSKQTKFLSLNLRKIQSYHNENKRFEWFDEQLDKINDLKISLVYPDIAQIIQRTLTHFNGLRYDLYAYCIMPNHIHVIIQQLPVDDGEPFPLSKITQSWKRHSSTQIKKLVNYSEPVWQTESYDHVIRNEQELTHYMEYLLENPVKAQLVKDPGKWKYTWINPKFL